MTAVMVMGVLAAGTWTKAILHSTFAGKYFVLGAGVIFLAIPSIFMMISFVESI